MPYRWRLLESCQSRSAQERAAWWSVMRITKGGHGIWYLLFKRDASKSVLDGFARMPLLPSHATSRAALSRGGTLDADEDLPCPAPLLRDRWRKRHQYNLLPGTRYLLGKPTNDFSISDGYENRKATPSTDNCFGSGVDATRTLLFETRALSKRPQKWLSWKVIWLWTE